MLGASIVVLSLFAVLLIAAVAATLARSNDVTAMTSGGMAFGPVAGGLAIAGLFAFAATALFPGLIHQHGFDALVPLVGLAGGLVLLSVLVGPALARSGSATLPELVGRRFGRIPRALVLAISLAATAGLLLGCLGTGISIAARTLDVSTGTAALTASALILALVLPGGLKSTLAGSRAVAILAGTALITGLALLTTILLTNPIPHVAYGATLRDIGPAELNLIENGAVDFGVFKPFLRELLTIDRLNWALLSLALMGAIAALPPLVQATGAFTASSTRRGLAWALTFAVIALTAIPALAAIARLETYRAVSAGSAFSDLPNWIRRGSEAGAIRLHGTSLGMIDTVSRDVAAGATSIDAISTAMADRGARSEAVWQRLDPAVQEAVLDLARKFEAAPQLSSADRW